MEFVNRHWTQIRVQLEGMTAAAKIAIGMSLTVLLLVGFLAVLYAGTSDMRPLSGFAAGRSDEVIQTLQTAGVEAELRGSTVWVPASDTEDALALLATGDLMSGDTYAAFKEMVASPWQTNAQSDREYLKAVMKLVTRIAQRIEGVRSAQVVIDPPREQGFGRTFVRPTGTVTVAMRSGPVPRQLQLTMARLVAGAVAEMRPQDVTVIDANTGRSFRVPDEDDALPTDVLELVRSHERQVQEKIHTLMSYIPGVVAAVQVHVDNTHQEHVEAVEYGKAQVRREHTIDREQRDYSRAGNAGVRPNTEMSIAGGADIRGTEVLAESDTEFHAGKPVQKSTKVLRGHNVERINATINVPRTHFVNIWTAENPDASEPPTADALAPVIEQELANIREQVSPQVASAEPGRVVAKMVYDANSMGLNIATAGGGIGALADSPWASRAGLGLLGVAALAMMFFMVKRATQEEELPDVRELAGIPEELPTDEEILGEAAADTGDLDGIELGEGEIRSQRMATQISDLITANPQEVGALLGKWVARDA